MSNNNKKGTPKLAHEKLRLALSHLVDLVACGARVHSRLVYTTHDHVGHCRNGRGDAQRDRRSRNGACVVAVRGRRVLIGARHRVSGEDTPGHVRTARIYG